MLNSDSGRDYIRISSIRYVNIYGENFIHFSTPILGYSTIRPFNLAKGERYGYYNFDFFEQKQIKITKNLLLNILENSRYLSFVKYKEVYYLVGKGFISTPPLNSYGWIKNNENNITLDFEVLYMFTKNNSNNEIKGLVSKSVFSFDNYKEIKKIILDIIGYSSYDINIINTDIFSMMKDFISLPNFSSFEEKDELMKNFIENCLIDSLHLQENFTNAEETPPIPF